MKLEEPKLKSFVVVESTNMTDMVFCMDAKLVVDAFNSNSIMFTEFGIIIKKFKSLFSFFSDNYYVKFARDMLIWLLKPLQGWSDMHTTADVIGPEGDSVIGPDIQVTNHEARTRPTRTSRLPAKYQDHVLFK